MVCTLLTVMSKDRSALHAFSAMLWPHLLIYPEATTCARFPFKYPSVFEFINTFLQTVSRHLTVDFFHEWSFF